MTAKNMDYYQQRISQELAAAERTCDPGIARIHLEMAQRYRDLLTGGFAANGGAAPLKGASAALHESGPAFG